MIWIIVVLTAIMILAWIACWHFWRATRGLEDALRRAASERGRLLKQIEDAPSNSKLEDIIAMLKTEKIELSAELLLAEQARDKLQLTLNAMFLDQERARLAEEQAKPLPKPKKKRKL